MTPGEVIQRYMAGYTRLRQSTVAAITAAWVRFGGPDDEDAARFLATALPIMTGAESAVAQLVAGYFATLGRVVTGDTVQPAIDIAKVTGAALRGVAPAEVYHRPVVTLRMALAAGKQYSDGFREATDRASTLAETDVLLAQRAATVEAGSSDERIVGYRRVLTGNSCVFCATVSTQRYHTAELMPIHPHCDCGVVPIFGHSDPGRVVNSELLKTLKQRGPDYYKQRGFVDSSGNPIDPTQTPSSLVAVHQHGEYGPTVTAAADNFTGPGDLA